MAGSRRNVLVVSADQARYGHFAPLLRRAEMDVDRVASDTAASALIAAVPFAAVIIGEPLDGDLKAIVKAVRAQGSPCRSAAVLVIAAPDHVEDMHEMIGRGVNRVVSTDASPEKIQEQVAATIEVAPRQAVRLPIRLDVEVDKGRNRLFCQTINLSETGMLIRMQRRVPVQEAFQFEFHLPGGDEPVSGKAEVVRHTTSSREAAEGIGVRFLSFDTGSRERLRLFLRELAEDDG